MERQMKEKLFGVCFIKIKSKFERTLKKKKKKKKKKMGITIHLPRDTYFLLASAVPLV